jgi:putative membrane-bound dehydrogenase-like protein
MQPVTKWLAVFPLVVGIVGGALWADPPEFPKPFDTQEGQPLSPQEALKKWQLPDGFNVSLFASEPEINQPIAITTDHRGRLWVCENYTYAENKVNFESKLRDRIVVLEDTDGDGKQDKRTVFWDQANKLTSAEIGFGGVFALCPPQLLFIPDKDGDDKPDGEPVVLLDGFDDGVIRHNIANGLKWGPDGWLYGRHGIQATSVVGPPGTPAEDRTKMNVGIWRYHPTHKRFEGVAHGTTNPWGMDWDENGQPFFINTVIGHLWHVVPGAHYQRMYGEPLRRQLYQLLPQTADHFHWDTKEQWHEIRQKGVTSTTDAAGGGHAHSGLMIYLGDNWPGGYRNRVFTLNFHGRRINCDRLERIDAAYTAKHEKDFAKMEDPWFRGIELIYGPDGGVYVADWSDTGECHENDGVHRTSGRIYKILYGEPKKLPAFNLAKKSGEELAALQVERNEWWCRQSRRIMQERAAAGGDLHDTIAAVEKIFTTNQDPSRRLRALWCLGALGQLTEERLINLLAHEDEHVRIHAIKMLADGPLVSPKAIVALNRRAEYETSGLALAHIASTLQKMPPESRWAAAQRIACHEEYANDEFLSLMLWYGIEDAVIPQSGAALATIEMTNMRPVRRFIARRLAGELKNRPQPTERLVSMLTESVEDVDLQVDVLGGVLDALRGWRKAPKPEAWDGLRDLLKESESKEVAQLLRELGVVFGDGQAVDQLKKLAADRNQVDTETRRRAVRSLVEARIDGLVPLLQNMLSDRDMAVEAIRGLAAVKDQKTPQLLVDGYRGLSLEGKAEAISTLVSRPEYAQALLTAVSDKKIDKSAVTPFQVRQMLSLGDEALAGKINSLWPELKKLSADKTARIEDWKKKLTPDAIASADRSKGRVIWDQNCAKCHKLFGEGGALGPDLTGAQRTNLHYLLENIIDPSATISKNFQMTVVQLTDGRVINGIVGEKTERTLAVATPTEKLVLNLDDIDRTRDSNLSLMPEGQLELLSPEQVQDLIGYLMSSEQVSRK